MWIISLATSTLVASTLVTSALVAGTPDAARATGLVAGVPDAADHPVAIWAMNEPAGARTMLDSGGRALNGTIGTEVGVGTAVDGERGYRFAHLPPDTPPTHPQHLVTVRSAPGLDPGTGDFAVTVRLRTTDQFGNVVQKGQSTVPGGNWKIQIPSGHPQCIFRGSMGTMLASAPAAINDGHWHTVVCLRDATGLWLAIDGTRVAGRAGHTGRITNTWPLTIGGKPTCDQIDVGCDYYSGDIDYVRIDAGRPDAAAQNDGGSGSGGDNPDGGDAGWDGVPFGDPGWDGPQWGGPGW